MLILHDIVFEKIILLIASIKMKITIVQCFELELEDMVFASSKSSE